MESTPDPQISTSDKSQILPYLVWVIAALATAGSLFFSEVMELPPCILCWYQRIAMYPLVVIVAVGIVTNDRRWKLYVWPLSLAGLAIAVYHNLLYYHIIPESITPCTEGVSCTSVQLEWLGFITIPLMSLTAFIMINVLMLLHRPRTKTL